MNAVDVIAQAIRVAGGDHTTGAGALAEHIAEALRGAGYDLTDEWVYSIGFPDEGGEFLTEGAPTFASYQGARAELARDHNWLSSDVVVRRRMAGRWVACS